MSYNQAKTSVMVTGASGHIGFHVASQLLELGYRLILPVRNKNRNTAMLADAGALLLSADLLNPESYKNHLTGIEVLFHIASENTTDVRNEEQVLRNTYGITKAVFDAALSKNVKTIIYTSSVVVLGRSRKPDILINENGRATDFESPYVKGKFLAEEYCNKLIKENHADIRRIYPSWVMGSNNLKSTPPHKLIEDYLKSGRWVYFKGGISIASVKEVAKAHINAWLTGSKHGTYVTAGENVTFKNLYSGLARVSGHLQPFIFLPKWLIYIAAIAGNKLGIKGMPNPRYVQAVIGNYSWYSSEKAIKELNYVIQDLDNILSDAISEASKKNVSFAGNNQ